MTFDAIMSRWPWRPIPKCPGRFVVSGLGAMPPSEIVAGSIAVTEHVIPAASDPVIVARFADGGGLISYRKPDGSFVHTLNTAEGFDRKLGQLGITA